MQWSQAIEFGIGQQQTVVIRIRFEREYRSLRAYHAGCQHRKIADIRPHIDEHIAGAQQAQQQGCLKGFPDTLLAQAAGHEAVLFAMHIQLQGSRQTGDTQRQPRWRGCNIRGPGRCATQSIFISS